MAQVSQQFTVPQNLIFNESNDWSLPEQPQIGTVGCFTADRAPDWDLFVIVDFNPETHLITAIFPRLKLNMETGNISVGQDKLNENFQDTTECVCPLPSQGDDFGCHCGAYETIKEKYHNTFNEMPENTMYNSISFVHFNFRKFDWIYHGHVSKKQVDSLDYPTEKRGKCCRVV